MPNVIIKNAISFPPLNFLVTVISAIVHNTSCVPLRKAGGKTM